MRAHIFLPFVLAACGSHTLTDVSTLVPTAPLESRSAIHIQEHTVSGNGTQRIAPGFAYSTAVLVHSDAIGRVTGKVHTNILDLSAYGYPGQVEMDADATCLRVVGNTAYVGAVTTRSSDPVNFPIGALSVFWVRDGGPGGADVGHAGPAAIFDPSNLICSSTPPALPADPVTSGGYTVR